MANISRRRLLQQAASGAALFSARESIASIYGQLRSPADSFVPRIRDTFDFGWKFFRGDVPGAAAVRCPAARCAASFRYDGAPGWYTLHVRYFDYAQGHARFRLLVGSQLVDEWIADDTLPTRRTEPDGTSSTRRVVTGVALRTGDEVRIEGFPDGSEDAALDYVEVHPQTD